MTSIHKPPAHDPDAAILKAADRMTDNTNAPGVLKRYRASLVYPDSGLAPDPWLTQDSSGNAYLKHEADAVIAAKDAAHAKELAERDARVAAQPLDFVAHLQHQRDWSERTFGPGMRTAGVCDHIRKELMEIEADPGDLKEWVDVVILALDGAWRSGATPAEILAAIVAKQAKNEQRVWPDWRTADPTKAIEHVRDPAVDDSAVIAPIVSTRTNTGHGHVWKRPDGVRARCGGPRMCAECAKDFAAQNAPAAKE